MTVRSLSTLPLPAGFELVALPTVAGESLAVLVAQAIGLALIAALVSGAGAFVFRLYTRERIPEGPALILGLGAVGIALNTRNVLIQFIGTRSGEISAAAAAVDIAMFVVAGVAASGGWLLGDRLAATDRFDSRALGTNLSPMVRAVGRTISVELPERIDDIDGYEPVAEETKEALQGRTLDFPRRLTVDQLEAKLVERLRDAHDVGYVDVDLEPDGTVAHLGLGRRPAGLGPTLPPGTVAVAVRGDPPGSASPGDTVQLWRAGESVEHVGTGELRAAVDDVATVVVDEGVAESIDLDGEYRLVTLASDARPDREFANLLRRAPETMVTVELPADSPLVGNPIGALDALVIAIRTAGGAVETLPARDRVIEAGEAVTVLGRPADVRALQEAASGNLVSGGTEGESSGSRESTPSTVGGADRNGDA